MEAAPVHIIQYFDGSKQGVIPLFQRPYSWEPSNWQTLWDDVINQYEEDEDKRSSHFMGALVTVPIKSVPVGVTKHLVIDGQQRLTTLSILLAAIRDKAKLVDDNKTVEIIGDLLRNRHHNAPDDLKLVPTQADRNAYNALVYGKELEQYNESRLIQAYRFFLRALDGTDSENISISPEKTLQAIQQTLQVVMINLGETDDPYLIFESLNHKGKPLNQADLVRNYVLMRFKHSTSNGGEQEAIYNDLWQPMELSLSDSMGEFLRHFSMRNGENVRKGEIYISSKKEFQILKTTDDVRNHLSEMKRSAIAYRKFLNPDEETNSEIRSKFQGILSLDQKAAYPLLIRIYRNWELGSINNHSIVSCLELLESFFVRRSVCNVPANSLNKLILELCSQLPSIDPHIWLFEKLLQWPGSRRWPSNEEFENAIINERIYLRPRIARYVLEALEDAHKHKEKINTSGATIEHVMPQTLSSDWQISLGTEFHSIHEKWGDTLGNLTLTGYNSELSNSPFSEKREMLKDSHYELSRTVVSESTWGGREIEARGLSLAKIALQRWHRN